MQLFTKATFILILILFAQSISAQVNTVMGTVNDAKSGATLPGVSVSEKGLSNGTITDANGRFKLMISQPAAVLIFSSIGFDPKEVVSDTRLDFVVSLTPSDYNLNEVVVTALGLERQSAKLGYAVQKLESEQIAQIKSPNFIDNLAGKLAGITITQGANGVGSTSKIVIRGEASFSNNNPLFVLDGTPINNNSIINVTNDDAAGFQEVDFGNGGMELSADDIASVTVLKGGAAAALYGTRASNGVIVITTKDGAMSGGLGIAFNTSTFIDKPFQLPQFQNTYGQGNSGKFAYKDGLGGGINDNISYSWGPELNAATLIPQYDSPVTLPDGRVVRGGDVAVHGGLPITQTPFVGYADNLKDFYEIGLTAINQIALTSGFDRGNFRISATDLRSKFIIPGSNLDRNNISARLNFRPTEQLKINTSINYLNARSKNRPGGNYGSENINYALVAWGPRSLDIENMKDYWQPGLDGLQQYSFNYTFFDNPYFTLLENRNAFNRDRIFGNISAEYRVSPEWSVHLRTGTDYASENRTFRRAFSSNRFKTGAYAEQNVFYRELNSDLLLNYSKTFSLFDITLSAGGNRMNQKASNVQTQALSLAQPGVYNLNNAASPLEVFDYQANKRINSLYAFGKFGISDYAFIDMTARNDWSSALATPTSTENTSFFYPSVSGSFILSKIANLPKAVSFAKLRASYAEVGNDTDPYQTASTFGSGVPFGGLPTISAQSTIANAALLPERTNTWETGFDVRLFQDRIRLDATYYDGVTKNQIISLPIAVSSGYNQQVVNGGAVRSRGLEVILGLSPVRNKYFQWNTQFNFSRNIATVEELPEGAGKLTLAYTRVYDNVNQTVWFQVEEGGRIGDMYGTGYKRAPDGQFLLNSSGGYIVDNTLKKLGNYNPDFILGLQNNLNYKNWNLEFLFDWRQGGILVSRTRALATVAGQLKETEDRPIDGIIAAGVVNTGTSDAPVYVQNTTAITAESYYRQYYDRNHEENNTYSASYLKLRSFSIGYTFENALQGTKQASKPCDITIALIGRNLFAISEIPHFDPEQLAIQGRGFVSGVENMSYASTRSFGLKLGVRF